MTEKPKINEEFIKKIQGKDFVLYTGLLDLAHQRGLVGISVDIIQYPKEENGMTAICKSTARSKEDVYTEIGDANPNNVTKMIVPHIIRMAATRAKARALRDFTNVGITCFEELGEINDQKTYRKTSQKVSNKKDDTKLANEHDRSAAVTALMEIADLPNTEANDIVDYFANKHCNGKLTLEMASRIMGRPKECFNAYCKRDKNETL